MTTATAPAAVLALLEAITLPVPLDEGQNLFAGPIIDPNAGTGQLSVYVLQTGGAVNEMLCGVSTIHRKPTVQVMIRCDRADGARGQQLADACWAACNPVSPPSGYVDCAVREASAGYYARQGEGRHVWAFNVVLTRVDAL